MTAHCQICAAHYSEPCNVVVHGLSSRVVELEAALRHTVDVVGGEPRGAVERLEAFVEQVLGVPLKYEDKT